MVIMTIYRVVFCVLPQENIITGISKMATKSTNNFSSRASFQSQGFLKTKDSHCFANGPMTFINLKAVS